LILQVGFVERFNPAIMALENVIEKPMSLSTSIASILRTRTDVDVILDLMIHDLDIILRFVNSPLTSVEAVGVPILSDKIDISNVRLLLIRAASPTLQQPHQCQDHAKIRFFGAEGYHSSIARNGNFISGKRKNDAGQWKIYQNNIEVGSHDPLEEEIRCFVNSVINRTRPLIQEKMPANLWNWLQI